MRIIYIVRFLSPGPFFVFKLAGGWAGAGGLERRSLEEARQIDANTWQTFPSWNPEDRTGTDLCVVSVNTCNSKVDGPL